MNRWSNAAPMWTLPSLRQANLDVKDKLIMSCFRSCKKNLSYACNVELKDVVNNLIFSRVLLPKPMDFVELQEFMDSCWRQLPGWQGLGQRPVLTAANIKLAKFIRCNVFLMRSTRSVRGERFGGGCCFLTVENIKQTFPRRCWGVTVAGRYAQCTGMLTLRIMCTRVIWREWNFCVQESKIITCEWAIHSLSNHP
eukprot:g30269.t1